MLLPPPQSNYCSFCSSHLPLSVTHKQHREKPWPGSAGITLIGMHTPDILFQFLLPFLTPRMTNEKTETSRSLVTFTAEPGQDCHPRSPAVWHSSCRGCLPHEDRRVSCAPSGLLETSLVLCCPSGKPKHQHSSLSWVWYLTNHTAKERNPSPSFSWWRWHKTSKIR